MAHRFIEQFAKKLGDHHIYPFRGPFSPLLCGIAWVLPEQSLFPIIFINKGRDTYWVVDEDVYFEYSQKKFKSYLDGLITISHLGESFEKDVVGAIDTAYERVVHADLETETDESLTELAKESLVLLTELVDLTLYIETFDFDNALAALGKSKEKLLKDLWENATHPAFLSFEGRRLKLMLDHTSKGLNQKNIRELSWIYTDYFAPKDFESVKKSLEEYIQNRDEKKKELEILEEGIKQKKKEHDQWFESLGDEEKHIVEYIQFVMELRDVRKDPIAKNMTVTYLVGLEMARRSGISPEAALTVIPLEYTKGIQYLKQHKEEIIARKDGFIMALDNHGTFEAENGDFDQFFKELNTAVAKRSESDVLKGQIANKGKAKGIVRIVLDPHDDKGFKDGDILVTSMTRPEFVPLMRRAAAVVTNEGGITSHAAIVSRELRIPCIIATKIATQFLKDGDMVEVDADQGIVTIIK